MSNFNSILSIASSVATIVASIVAIYALWNWRKQQIYGTKFNIIMELEDNYELLLTEYATNFKWLLHAKKAAIESKDQSKEQQKIIDDTIKTQFDIFLKDNKIAVYSRGYQLAYCRAKRISPTCTLIERLEYSKLEIFFESCDTMLKNACFENKEATESLIQNFAFTFSEFINSGRQSFKTHRESL